MLWALFKAPISPSQARRADLKAEMVLVGRLARKASRFGEGSMGAVPKAHLSQSGNKSSNTITENGPEAVFPVG
jgi:hypothetical protein